MGWTDFLFGGAQVKDLTSPEVRGIANQMANYNPGIGADARYAKKFFNRLGRGHDLSEISPSVQLAQARGARDWTSLQRQIQMNTAMMPGEQTALTAGLLSKGYLQNQDNTGLQALQGAANDISNFSNIYRAGKNSADQLALQGLAGAGNLLMSGRQLVQKKGLFDHLGTIANLASRVIPGIGQATAMVGGMGAMGAGGSSSNPWGYWG